MNIEDLFAPLPERTRLGGPGPFVINLIASSAPIDVPAKGIAGCAHAHVYQVQRIEDRRPRYRLRLGPFTHEDDADAELLNVRDIYPGALTATADADDLRIIAALPVKAPVPSAVKPMVPTLVEEVTKPVQTPAVRPTAAAPAKAVDKPAAHTVAKPATKAAAPAPAIPKPAATKPTIPAMMAAIVPVRAPLPPQAEQSSQRAINLESTQTVRALTQLELEDDQASRWFAIQLSLAEEAFDPETLPNLDIFRVYRLYSVAGIDQGRIVHALRLGFFTEQSAAGAVASYLTVFYDKPTIKRVSSAERERFAEQSLEARKDVGATGRQAVIEITNERYVREKRVGQGAAK